MTYPSGVLAPVSLPDSTGEYNTPSTAATTLAGLATALGAATAGQKVYLAAGTYTGGLALNGIAKGSGNPVRVVPADPYDPPVIKGSFNGGTPVISALTLTNCTGLAFDGAIRFAVDNAPDGSINYYRVIDIKSGCSNLWFRGVDVSGTEETTGAVTGYGLGTTPASGTADTVSNLNLIGCKFHHLRIAMILVNVGGFQSVFNLFENLSDDCHQCWGLQDAKLYYNLVQNDRIAPGLHPDFFQIGTGSKNSSTGVATFVSKRSNQDITIYRNFVACDPENGADRRRQGVLIQNEVLRYEPSWNGLTPTSPSVFTNTNILVQGNLLYGLDFNAITIKDTPDTNTNVKDNEVYHITGITGDPVTQSFLSIDFTSVAGHPGSYTPLSGAITGNVTYVRNTANAVNMTGQTTNQSANSAYLKTGCDRETAKATWLVERSPFKALV